MSFKLDSLEHDSQEDKPLEVTLPSLDIETILEDCNYCDGGGEIDGRECSHCRGEGTKELVIKVPDNEEWCRESNPSIWIGDDDDDDYGSVVSFLNVEGI